MNFSITCPFQSLRLPVSLMALLFDQSSQETLRSNSPTTSSLKYYIGVEGNGRIRPIQLVKLYHNSVWKTLWLSWYKWPCFLISLFLIISAASVEREEEKETNNNIRFCCIGIYSSSLASSSSSSTSPKYWEVKHFIWTALVQPRNQEG